MGEGDFVGADVTGVGLIDGGSVGRNVGCGVGFGVGYLLGLPVRYYYM